MAKKSFQTAPKPSNQLSIADIEAFERGGAGQDTPPQTRKPANVGLAVAEKTKRLSVDLPESVHTRFKTVCSAHGLKMTKEIENFILVRCEELEKQ
ncbi:MAG: hypothetical protein KDJ38_02285 [Gammaproteobacteria bacterium]|nr:hypothetical protein [Gammaproteobacteria bacterium]